MSAYRDPEPRAPVVLRVGILRFWALPLVVLVPLVAYAVRTEHYFWSLALLVLVCVTVWSRSKTIVVDPAERIVEVDEWRVPFKEIVGVSARSQLELVVSVEGREDIVLVPAALTDAEVVRRANALREAIWTARDGG